MPHVAYQQWDSASAFGAGAFAGTEAASGSLRLSNPTGTFTYADPFGDGSSTAYDVGTWTSPVVTPGFAYTELVSSWNADTPAGTWVQVSVHGKADDGTTSKEYVLGRWAEDTDAIHRTSVPAQGDTLATVAIDTLIARKGRTLTTGSSRSRSTASTAPTATPSVSLVGAMASAVPDGQEGAGQSARRRRGHRRWTSRRTRRRSTAASTRSTTAAARHGAARRRRR